MMVGEIWSWGWREMRFVVEPGFGRDGVGVGVCLGRVGSGLELELGLSWNEGKGELGLGGDWVRAVKSWVWVEMGWS